MIIFPTTPENSQFFETVLNKTYLRLRTKTGIDFVTDHMYRHSFATRLVENSVDYKALSSLMGHTDVSFALRDMLQQNMTFFVNRLTCFIKHEAGSLK